MLLTVDLYEDFIDVKGITVSSVFSLHSAGINGTEFYAPEPDSFVADYDASFGERVLDVSMAQVVALVEPDGIGEDIGRESVALVSIHELILAISAS
jgi:hypothetical protein